MDRTLYRLLRIALLSSSLLLPGCDARPQLVEQRILQFGTVIDIAIIDKDIEKAETALLAAEQQLQQFRHHWHAWENSDLFQFNRAINRLKPVTIPASLKDLIHLSQQYYQSSQGLFNPALGKLIAAYGFHQDSTPDAALIARIQQDLPTMLDLKTEHGQAFTRHPHLALDFGGIAKGYALALLAESFKAAGFEDFLINAGGDVHLSGSRFGQPWSIGVQNPFAPGAIASIQLKGQKNLFTSGNYQRFYQQDGAIIHHIIDPRTGRPATGLSAATVLADNPVVADVAATTLMIGGWKNHRSLAQSLGIQDYLIINQDQRMVISRSLASKMAFSTDKTYTIVD